MLYTNAINFLDNGIGKMIAQINGNSTEGKIVAPGVYEVGHFNFLHDLPFEVIEYPAFEQNDDSYRGPYGVCDNVDQIFATYPELKESEDRVFLVSMTPILKANQSPDGGWRWHKWGSYIGTHDIQCEYLYDEVGIEKVYCFHIYEVPQQ